MNRAEIAVLIACFVVALLGGLVGWLDYQRTAAIEPIPEPACLTLDEEERLRRDALDLTLPGVPFGDPASIENR